MEIPDEMFESAESHSDEILAIPGVAGWDVGIAEYDGELSEDLAIRIYVDDLSQVEDGQFPSDYDGYPTNLLEGSFDFDVSQDHTRYETLIGGCEIENGDLDISASGTLGLIARDVNRGVLYGVTNAHVLCHADYQRGNAICQPARTGSGPPAPADVIGVLSDWKFDIDCAIFEIRESIVPLREILQIGPVTGSRVIPPIDPFNYVRVSKRGVATGLTSGDVIGETRIPTTSGNGKWLPPHLTVRLASGSQYSEEGDSGAAVVDGNGLVVGLHFGHYGTQYGLAVRWERITAALPIEVAT